MCPIYYLLCYFSGVKIRVSHLDTSRFNAEISPSSLASVMRSTHAYFKIYQRELQVMSSRDIRKLRNRVTRDDKQIMTLGFKVLPTILSLRPSWQTKSTEVSVPKSLPQCKLQRLTFISDPGQDTPQICMEGKPRPSGTLATERQSAST